MEPKKPKDDRLPSLMAHMISRLTLIVVILLAPLVLYGCSSLTQDPREQANESISTANEAVAQHNELFQETRDTYQKVKEKIETSGGDSEEDNAFKKEKDRLKTAQSDLEEAQGKLEEARDSLEGIKDLEVEQPVKRYAKVLRGAMKSQISAESKEIDFYGVLIDDPTLEDNRQKAEELLTQAGDGYQDAENSYQEAQELADANPDLLGPGPTVPETTPEG
ncbi:hypothetical protein BH23ACT11_BH23ACT11_00640 [soil metagenome]